MSIIRIRRFAIFPSGVCLIGWIALILLFFSQEGRATVCTTTASGPWHTPSVWVSGIIPHRGDTAIISAGDSVWLDSSTTPLSLVTVNGSLYLGNDTLFLDSANSSDTLIFAAGTIDAATGWFLDSGVLHPIIHCTIGSLFRTSGSFPFLSSSIFDSAVSPYFVLDSGSNFEYYAASLQPTDISYLLNNIIGHAYQNLLLTNVAASFTRNPLTILGTLHIGFGASMITDYTPQTITLSGDVLNDNEGESGSPGAGLRGCGILSLGQDTWVFDTRPTGAIKDTCHWVGPSQLGNVIIMPNTVLSVRFISDTICDSLDVLNNIIEEGGPCGGHLIGRVYSELPRMLGPENPTDTFAGMIIHSGTGPYLGRTRIMSTSGYAPPGANTTNIPVLRYYRISPGAGPQYGSPDTMSFVVQCDEMNGTTPAKLHFWRSRDRGQTWAFSGITSYNVSQNLFTWDTTVLGWPNDSGSFYWMLSEGYMDIPLPVELQNFTAVECGDSVQLEWQTASEVNLAGFEIDRVCVQDSLTADSEVIASFWNDDSLRARSETGASYSFTDLPVPSGGLRYDLYEVSQDGIRELLASRTPTQQNPDTSLTITHVSYSSGKLSLHLSDADDAILTVMDDLGRSILSRDVTSGTWDVIIPAKLISGTYFIEVRADREMAFAKFMVLP